MRHKDRKVCPGGDVRTPSPNHTRGNNALLCGQCKKFTPDFSCMHEKRCFLCTEIDLRDPEKFVTGVEEGVGFTLDEEKFVKGFEDGAGTSATEWMALHRDEKSKALVENRD
jgi:hypothetical protein